MNDSLRVYFDPAEIGQDGYPFAWHGTRSTYETNGPPPRWESTGTPIKDLIRERDDHRCLRCGHPYRKGAHGNGEWSRCDEHCTHGGPVRRENFDSGFGPTEAQWRILTVHHLNGIKHDCRWWNLVSLCQRCHLAIQAKVIMDRVYPLEHSEWFKPFAAAWYAFAYLREELTREEVNVRMEELLDLERMA